MQYNFEFLNKEKKYSSFTNACIDAEKSLTVSYSTTAILARRALELAIKWVFSYDDELEVPYQDNLASLMHDYKFKSLIDSRLFPMITYIQKLGNKAVHSSMQVTRQQAILSLNNLFEFISWIDYCYSDEYIELKFDETILADKETQKKTKEELKLLYDELGKKDRKLEEIIKENEELRQENSKKRVENEKNRVFNIDELSEFDTRKMYIDLEIELCNWKLGTDCIEEFMVKNMPNDSKIGYVDYILFDDDNKPLALIEAKKTSANPKLGKIQAQYYADSLEKEYGVRPVIFYTNGFEYYIWDDKLYPERKVSGLYTKEELQQLHYKRENRISLKNIDIDNNITDRYYQKMAVDSVCEAFDKGSRKALIVMATGAGKTRTVISLVDVLIKKNYIKNILFLADRTTLVKQAKKNFKALLPELSLCNLLDSKDNPNSRMVFSTYPTMMNAIDDIRNEDGEKLFTRAHFDLIILDESHRSIYKKYQAIFQYFDSMLVGLTATPRNDIDKNTYSIFELEDNVPTYAYELDEAIKDKYLVPYHTIEIKLKLIDKGVHYDELSEKDKEEIEEKVYDDKKDFDSSEINKRLFNNETVDIVLKELMEKGLKIESGEKLGKTIIFAKNTNHADFIVERFDKLYPEYKGKFAQAIYNEIRYCEQLIEHFSDKEKMPQIAVSVDMLDTGVDVPEVLNLVFFKKVRSKTKFWQMIGRGTRLCKNLFDIGEDKTGFRIFDYCGNFDFFREPIKIENTKIQKSLTERLFNIRVLIVKELQNSKYQNQEYISYRKTMVDRIVKEIQNINEEKFNARMKIKFIHKFNQISAFENLFENDIKELEDNIAPLVLPTSSDELAKRFDYLMYAIEYMELKGISSDSKKKEVIFIAEKLSEISNSYQIKKHMELIEKIQTNDYWKNATIFDYEIVRDALRELVKFIESKKRIIYTDISDEIIHIKENGFENNLVINDLRSYRKKVESYLKDHKDDIVIYKLRHNKPLIETDIKYLEDILWNKLGTKEDYTKEYKEEPLLKFVSRMVGFDIETANQEFSEFLSDESLNINQMNFVRLIVEYIVKNGSIDKKVINDLPFNANGNILELFDGKMDIAIKIVSVIDKINDRLIV